MSPTPLPLHARPGALAQALRVVAEPRPEDPPGLRLLAWCVLKSHRGQPVLQTPCGAGRRT